MQQVTDVGMRKLLGDLADAERKHYAAAMRWERRSPTGEATEGRRRDNAACSCCRSCSRVWRV